MSQAPLDEKELAHATQSKDGYVANIAAVNRMAHEGKSFSGNERNCVFLNRGDAVFAPISALSGWDYPDDSRGIALTDWDRDGKVDFWVSNRNAPRVRLMRNQLESAGNWVGFKLVGKADHNRDAIGARIRLKLTGGRVHIRTLQAGEGFASQSSKLLHIGLGKAETIESLSVVWPDGVVQQFKPVAVNGYYRVTYGREVPERIQPLKRVVPSKEKMIKRSAEQSSAVRSRLKVPFPAPVVRYRLLGDQKSEKLVDVSKLERPLMVSLWSQGCADCIKELRDFTANADLLRGKVDILALCTDQEVKDLQGAQSLIKDLQFPWRVGTPTALSNQQLSSIFHHTLSTMSDLPTPSAVLISKEGNVIALYQGRHSIKSILADVEADKKVDRWLKRPELINLLYLPRQLMGQGKLNDAMDYISRAHEKLSAHKEYAVLLAWVADELKKRNQLEHAAAYYKTAYHFGQHNPVVLNNVAWVSATHQNPKMRNAALALKSAQRCVQLTRGEEPAYLDTLAAAHAENGDFAKALAVTQKAMQLAEKLNRRELLPGLKKAIGLYKLQKPVREP